MAKRESRGTPSDTTSVFIPAGSAILSMGTHASLASPTDIILGMAGGHSTVVGIVPPGGITLGLAQPHALSPTPQAGPARPTGDGTRINAWEDDPGSGVLDIRPVPVLPGVPGVRILDAAPAPGQYPAHTTEFRYWTAAEALVRGTAFWHGIVGALHWKTGASLPVSLDDAAPDFNAFYDRQALRFFHGDTRFGRVWSGESPDIVCHELGHAVLDAIKPQLWGAASHEAAALHEAFGDISALLCALQLESLRRGVLDETAGRLYSNSRLSRMAEQLGAAIRLSNPQDVDPDCLRNAVNRFTYSDPNGLPHQAPASMLSSEPHSFSRIFSGAFLEALAGVLSATAGAAPSEAQLANVSTHMAQILVRAIRRTPVVSNLFAQVAAGMVVEAAKVDQLHARILRTVFIRRNLLSPGSAARATGYAGLRHVGMSGDLEAPPDVILGLVAVGAGSYGLQMPLAMEAPSQAPTFAATAAAADATPIPPSSGLSAAISFADDMFRRGRVDYGDAAGDMPLLHIGQRFTTHKLEADDGAMRLTRCCFDCGLRRD